ncbi:MAG TPA: 2-phospho-L-lactate guanylyltransferase [Candidatus Sulfotelmatobacter sp.]|nr:2-phospho-L-lactate guanylyltransferase [Candidatus Sulfotelmatobacter sp.]
MNAILIPVKEFHESKKRLAPHFSPADRAALAEALCRDFFSTVAGVRGVDRVFVISKEPVALEWARTFGWETIRESHQVSESSSVDAASSYCAHWRVNSLLRLPIDIPVVEAEDIEAIFDKMDSAPAVVIVPSRDGTGTNALLRNPPNLFPSHFGPNSFALHLAEAERCGVRARVLRNARIELDIDELDEVRSVAGLLRRGSATAKWAEDRGILRQSTAIADGKDKVFAASASAKAPESAGR